jgi:hypothetical protein
LFGGKGTKGRSRRITDRELAEMDPDEHRQAFMAFLAGLLGDFDRYLDEGDVDLRRDGAGYRLIAMWLDDQEFTDLVTELSVVLQSRLANAPGPGRRRRMLGTVMLPG